MKLAFPSHIHEELQGHIDDMVEDLVSEGVNEEDARAQAAEAFGDFDAIAKEVKTVDGVFGRISGAQLLVSIYIVVFASILFGGLFLGGIGGSAFELPLLWWSFVGGIGMVVVGVRWLVDYMGFGSTRVVQAAYLFTAFIGFGLTRVLDIDNFEVNLHVLLFGVVLYGVVALGWNWFSVKVKKVFVYSFAVLATWSVLAEQPIFDFWGTARCLYITRDNIPLEGALATCQQVSVFSGMIIPIHVTTLTAVVFFIHFLWKEYWKSPAVSVSRKVILTSMLIGIAVVPSFIKDINNYGELDVVPWKQDIYTMYWEVLGRRPEQKDIEFYARIRAYENLGPAYEVLWNSSERRLKIRLVYSEVLGRYPTDEELQQYRENRRTVDGIYQDLCNLEEARGDFCATKK